MTKEEFKLIRKEMGLTQKKFAEQLGKGLRTIQDYENGKYAIPLHVKRTADLLVAIFDDRRFLRNYGDFLPWLKSTKQNETIQL